MFLYFYCILQVLTIRYGFSSGQSIANKNIKHLVGQIDAQDETNDYESSSVDSSNMDAIKYKRVLLQNNYDSYDPTLLKNTVDDKNIDYGTSRDSFPYGIVYNNGKPLGILEPLPREYRNIRNLEGNIQLPEQTLENMYPVRKLRENSHTGRDFEEPQQLIGNPYPTNTNEDYGNDNSPEFKRSDNIAPNLEQENSNIRHTYDSQENNENKSQQKRECNKNSNIKKPSEVLAKKEALVKRNSEIDDYSSLENPVKESTNKEIVSLKKRGSDCCKKNHKQHQHEKEDQDQEKSDENSITESNDKSKKHIISVDDNHIQKLKTTLDKMRSPTSSEDMETVERNLRSLLMEMGLADKDANSEIDSPAKRSIYNEEDENLEGKTNTIEISKVDNVNERNKREEQKEVDNKNDLKHKRDKNQHSESVITKHFKKKETDKKNRKNKNSETNTNTKEDNVRTKREGDKSDATEIMKNMEGELTITGNKSPLASSGNLNAHLNQNTSPSALSDTDNNQLSYQERIERNIQSKIDAIKEEVRKEIETLKNKEKRSIIMPHPNESSRTKRQTAMNLLNEETPEIDPGLNIEGNLKPLIRRRRHTSNNLNRKDVNEKEEQKLEKKPNVNNDNISKKSAYTQNEDAEDNFNAMDNVQSEDSLKKRSLKKIKDALSPHKRNVEIEVPAASISKKQNVETNQKLRNRRGLSPDNKNLDQIFVKSNVEPKLKRKKREAYESIRDYAPDEYYYRRRKRGEGPYFPYRDDDYEMEIEGDEFDEEGYYDKNRQRKRQTEYDFYNPNMEAGDSEFLSNNPSVNYPNNNNRYKRLIPRRRRQNDDQILDDEYRLKRESEFKTRDESERQQLSDLPETDLFGALPQSYVGELTRYKRVKRQKGS